jgi:hypothetical protein
MPRAPIACLACLLGLVLATGCKPPDRSKIVRDIDLNAPQGAPKIAAIEDLGSVPLIMNKPLKRDRSDGIAVVGELLVIRGRDLGKQPQVMVGQTAIEVLARTEDGGIVFRAPMSLTAGDTTVTVNHFKGGSSHPLKLRRFGLAVLPGLSGLQVLEVQADGVQVLPKSLIASAPAFLDLHPQGSVAYAVTGGATPRLLVVDFAAAGGPAIVNQRTIGEDVKAVGFAVASQAKVAVAVTEKAIILFDLDDPRDPLRYNPARFPPGLLKQGVQDVKLSPDGKTLVVLAAQTNAVVLFDVSDPNKVRHTEFLPLLADAKEPLARALHFTYEPKSDRPQILWVATGDTPQSQIVGKHAPTLLKIAITSAPDPTELPKLQLLETLALPGTNTPHTLDTTYAVQQIASASVLRNEPSRMNFFIGTFHPDLFLIDQNRLDTPTGLQQGAELLRKLQSWGAILKVDGRGQGAVFHEGPELVSAAVVSADGKFLVAATCRPEVSVSPPKVEIPCGLVTKSVDGGAAKWIPLGRLLIGGFRSPYRHGLLLLQP